MHTLISLFTDTSRLHHKYHHKIFESFNLHRGQGRLIHKLSEADGITQKELATKLNITPATLTRMVQNMEKNGFITRSTSEVDNRKTLIYLTDKGFEVREQLHKRLLVDDSKIFKDFSAQEKEQLESMLLKIQNRLKKEIDCENNN